MLRIRSAQLAQLGDTARGYFKQELLEHFRDFAPELFRVAGEEQFRLFIEYGLEKGDRLGLTLRGPLRLLLDVMCILGHDVEIDPQYRPLWPEGDPASAQMPFAERLHRNFGAYHRQCVGADNQILRRAIDRILNMPITPRAGLHRDAVEMISAAYPEKYAFIGEHNFTTLIVTCQKTATGARLTSELGKLLTVILAVCFGSNFLQNPLYPWIGKRLTSEAPEEQRVERTMSALRVYAVEALATFERSPGNATV